MKQIAWAPAALAAPPTAQAQDKKRERARKAEELQKTHERAARERPDRGFKEKVEALRREGAPRKEEAPKVDPGRAIERLAGSLAELRRDVNELKRRFGERAGQRKEKGQGKAGQVPEGLTARKAPPRRGR